MEKVSVIKLLFCLFLIIQRSAMPSAEMITLPSWKGGRESEGKK